MTFSGPIEDRLSIRERLGAYADATFRRDVEAWLDCWVDDGVRAVGGKEVRGKAALRIFWNRVWDALDRMAFFTEVAAIEAAGDAARARSYCREILLMKDGGRRKVVGIYEDELVRDAGVWRFARREYKLFMDEGAVRPI